MNTLRLLTVLSHCSKDELLHLRGVLHALPPPLPGSSYHDVSALLTTHGVRPSLAASIQKTLTGDFHIETWKSAVERALFQKFQSYQGLCLIVAIGAVLLTTAGWLLALERGGGMYLVFVGGIIGGCIGAYGFSQEKKRYVGSEADFQKVEALRLDFRPGESKDLY